MNRRFSALFVTAVSAFVAQLALERHDRRVHPPPGDLIDVGERRLHVIDAGSGSTPVVFESGLGCYSLDWHRIAAEVSTFTRTVRYDRFGLGWSDSASRPRDANAVADDLQRLLGQLDITQPVVIVAHSFGGVYARVFTQHYPERVAAMLLIDASPTDQRSIFGTQEPIHRWKDTAVAQLGKAGALANRFGMRRWFGGAANVARFYDPEVREMARALESRARATDWLFGEALDVPASEAQALDRNILGSRPLVVLTALWGHDERGMNHTEFNEAWMAAQSDLARLSSQSLHIVANTRRHVVHLDEPDLVAGVIRQLVERVRSDS